MFLKETLDDIGLAPELFHPDRMEFWGRINLLKGGIVYADYLNTVSRGYAREIQTPEYGFGLDGALRARTASLCGIVNGVDYSEWSPEVDQFIAAHYSTDDLAGKRACKTRPAGRVRLAGGGHGPAADRHRLALHQPEGFRPDCAGGAGAGGRKPGAGGARQRRRRIYEALFRDLAAAHPGTIAVRFGYNNALSHKIEAGSDMFLMPSRYEPCGLNQIFSLR